MSSENRKPRRAAVYVRISKDDEGKEGAGLGTQRQEKECRSLAAQLGWGVGKVYVDNDISAFGGKTRPRYQELLGDIRAGHVDGVLAWHTDRLHRDLPELEGYIDACEPRRVATQTVKAGELDLTTSAGRMVARILGAVARQEVEHMIERIKAAHQQRRERGEWHGGPVPYGYRKEPTGEIRKQRVVHRLVIDETEAAVIREAAGKVLDGGSLRAICRDLNDRGVPSPRAARGYKAPPARYSKGGWQIANMRAMLLRPLTAGLISFDEDWKQDGRRRARPSWQSPVVGKGNWEPILSTETSERLKAVLTSPARRTSKPGPYYRWLLSGIARCGVCGSRNLRVGTQHRSGRRHYVCEDGAHVARVADDVDALVEIAVIKRLSHPGFAASLNPPVDVAALDARRDVLSAELDAFARQPGITPSQLAIVSEPKLAELKQISEKITAAYGGSAFDGIAGAADPAAAFKNAGIARQRQLVDALFTVTILPVSHDGPLSAAERQRRYRARRKAGGPPVKRGPAFRPDSVRIEPRDDIAQRSVT